jgi:hypothetical protein
MKHGDAIQSVTHVADVNRYPCSGLNTDRGGGSRVECQGIAERCRSWGSM